MKKSKKLKLLTKILDENLRDIVNLEEQEQLSTFENLRLEDKKRFEKCIKREHYFISTENKVEKPPTFFKILQRDNGYVIEFSLLIIPIQFSYADSDGWNVLFKQFKMQCLRAFFNKKQMRVSIEEAAIVQTAAKHIYSWGKQEDRVKRVESGYLQFGTKDHRMYEEHHKLESKYTVVLFENYQILMKDLNNLEKFLQGQNPCKPIKNKII